MNNTETISDTDVQLEAACALVSAALACLSPLGPSCEDDRWQELTQSIAESDFPAADHALAALTVLGTNLGLFPAVEGVENDS